MASWESEGQTMAVRRPNPTQSIPSCESERQSIAVDRKKRKGKSKKIKSVRAAYSNSSLFYLLLKPVIPTPSNTWSQGSFHRDIDWCIKVLPYREFLQQRSRRIYKCQ